MLRTIFYSSVNYVTLQSEVKHVPFCKSFLSTKNKRSSLMVISSYLKRRIPLIQFDHQITFAHMNPIPSQIRFLYQNRVS
jgi:hypothetical protein